MILDISHGGGYFWDDQLGSSWVWVGPDLGWAWVGLGLVTLTVDLVGTLNDTFELIDATDLVECLDSAEGVNGFGIAIFGDSDAERRIEPRDSLADNELLSECFTERPSSVIKEVVVLLGLNRL